MHDHKRRIRPVVVEEVAPKPNIVAAEDLPVPDIVSHVHNEPPIMPEPTETKKNLNISLWVVLAVLIFTIFSALFAGGVYVYLKGTNEANMGLPTNTEFKPTPIPVTIVPTVSPSPTPLSHEKLATLKISILNGSGKVGEAGKAKSLLEDKGFIVSKTSNADSYDFVDTIVQLKGEVSAAFDPIKTALSSRYSVKRGEALPSRDIYDVIITVGSK